MSSISRVAAWSIFGVLLALAAACASTNDPAPSGAACTNDLPSIQARILGPKCATSGCHDEASRAATLVLTDGKSEADLVGRGAGTCDGIRVVPGSPETSVLVRKLSDGATCGARMPLGLAELSDAEKACIREWIRALPPTSDAGGDTAAPVDCGDTSSNPNHCGACGKVCPPGATCSKGTCVCPDGLSACGALCVDTKTNAESCGACGKACAKGALCVSGGCVCPDGSDGTAMSACGAPPGKCADLTSDGANCGACGTTCTGATPVCIGKTCAASCGALTQCGSSCVDTQTSFAHCGACGKECPAGASCQGGVCACPAGTRACPDGAPTACLPTDTDPNNCGACGKRCEGGSVCSGGACTCPGGGKVCGGTCVDTKTSAQHCGDCDRPCQAGQTCSAGVCTCGASVSFAAAVQPILTRECTSAGCHGNTAPKEGLRLTAGNAYGGLVGVPASQCADGRLRVAPSNPAASYLMNKIENQRLCSGTPMPKAGGLLGAADIATISTWICNGAPNN